MVKSSSIGTAQAVGLRLAFRIASGVHPSQRRKRPKLTAISTGTFRRREACYRLKVLYGISIEIFEYPSVAGAGIR